MKIWQLGLFVLAVVVLAQVASAKRNGAQSHANKHVSFNSLGAHHHHRVAAPESQKARRHHSLPIHKSTKMAKRHYEFSRLQAKLSNENAALYNVPGLFFTDVAIGSPPKNFRVQLDTGSSTLAIPGHSCGCTASPHGGYHPLESDTSHTIPCDENCIKCSEDGQRCYFEIMYGDGSGVSGSMYRDTIKIGGMAAPAIFGVIENESDGFEPENVDGILGLAFDDLNCDPTCAPSIFSSIVGHNQASNSFSLCLSNQGGVLTIGGADPSHYSGPIMFTPIVEEDYYVVELTDMRVAGKSLGLNPGYYNGSIVDSGTTLLILPQTAFDVLVTILEEKCREASVRPHVCRSIIFGNSFNATEEEIAALPTIQFALGGPDPFIVNLPAWAYIRSDLSEPEWGVYVFGISSQPDGNGVILGDTFMEPFYIVFDRDNDVLGFANAQNCNPTCSQHTEVSGCTAELACGWCSDNSTCMLGDPSGPVITSTCKNWIYH